MKKNTKEIKSENGSAAVIALTAILALLIGIAIGFGIKYLIDENSDDNDTDNTSKHRVADDNEIENNYSNENSTNSVNNTTNSVSNTTNSVSNTSNDSTTISLAGYTFSLPEKYTIYKESGSGSSKGYQLKRNNDEKSLYAVTYAGQSTFETLKSKKQELQEKMKSYSGISNVQDIYDNTYNGYNYIYMQLEDNGFPAIAAFVEFDTNEILLLEFTRASGTVTTYDINVFIDEVIKNKKSSVKSNISTEEGSGDIFDAIDRIEEN